MGSDESHFNVSLIVRHKATRQCPETTIFEDEVGYRVFVTWQNEHDVGGRLAFSLRRLHSEHATVCQT